MFRAVSALLLFICCAQSWAERALLSGELGGWLQQSAIPELTETLAQHPKFSGQPLRIAAVNGAQASSQSSALADAISQQLTHAILRKGKNDVANQQDPAICNKVPRPVYYLVGIQIEPLSSSNHRVSLAVLDLESGMWVSGISLTWQGRLLNSERRALATLVQNAPVGSLENPLRLSDTAALAEGLYKQLQCRLPRSLEGTLTTTSANTADATQDSPDLQLVMYTLHDKLSLAAHAMSRDEEDATWTLQPELQQVTTSLHLLTLDLRENSSATNRQRLASVYVSGPAAQVVAPHPATPLYPAVALLSELLVPRQSRRCNDTECAEISFALNQDAYLLVFRTHRGSVTPLNCRSAAELRSAGEQFYRLQAAQQQRVGFFVIASRDRQAIRRLQQQFRDAPGACGQAINGDSRWLQRTINLLRAQQTAYEWRAVHFVNTPQGPQLL